MYYTNARCSTMKGLYVRAIREKKDQQEETSQIHYCEFKQLA